MSSTISPESERGQILIIFAASLLVIFGIAALVFDGGFMLLEKRDQQNAADAAAIAGARFLPGDQAAAEAEAEAIAADNGFQDGVGDQTVTVTFPTSTRIAVEIEDKTPSFFARIWGLVSHDVGSRAVAMNGTQPLGPFGMLTLNEDSCPPAPMDVGGSGLLESGGDIQVNSPCEPRGWWLRGTGEIVVADGVACRVVGGFDQSGNPDLRGCIPVEDAVPIPDPFLGLDPYEPPVPVDGSGTVVYPAPVVQEGGTTKPIPAGCPGAATPASHTAPALCVFNSSFAGTTWRFSPGYYPGGLDFQAGTFYLEPGIYHIGGGGFNVNGVGATVRSVAPGETTLGGGVLIFNGHHTTGAAADGDITLNGGAAGVNLWPLTAGTWAGMVVYQDSDICERVTLNGSASLMEVRGTIYVPCGKVFVSGNGGTIRTDQIVADMFEMSGNIGSLQVVYDTDFLPGVRLAGLIE